MYFICINTLKGITKAPAEDLLRLNSLRCTTTTFLTPERCDKQLCPIYIGVPPPGTIPIFITSQCLRQCEVEITEASDKCTMYEGVPLIYPTCEFQYWEACSFFILPSSSFLLYCAWFQESFQVISVCIKAPVEGRLVGENIERCE